MAQDPPHLSAVPAAAAQARAAEPVVDVVPEEVREAARRAFAERDQQAHVLPLGYDSLLADPTVEGPRRLTFGDAAVAGVVAIVHAAEGGSAEVEVDVTSLGCSLVEVHCGGAVFSPDTAGRTRAGPAPHGLFSAVLESAAGRRLRTSWIRV